MTGWRVWVAVLVLGGCGGDDSGDNGGDLVGVPDARTPGSDGSSDMTDAGPPGDARSTEGIWCGADLSDTCAGGDEVCCDYERCGTPESCDFTYFTCDGPEDCGGESACCDNAPSSPASVCAPPGCSGALCHASADCIAYAYPGETECCYIGGPYGYCMTECPP